MIWGSSSSIAHVIVLPAIALVVISISIVVVAVAVLILIVLLLLLLLRRRRVVLLGSSGARWIMSLRGRSLGSWPSAVLPVIRHDAVREVFCCISGGSWLVGRATASQRGV